MAIIHVDESTPGLPNSGRLSGTNGDLVGILDVALPLNGWAIEYSTGNARIYRPGSGNRFRLYVNDDSAISGAAQLATVRGCENASAASNAGLTDPFPLASQSADGLSVWIKSNTANTTARAFDIWVGETFVIFSVNTGSTTNVWDLQFFGDIAPALPGDAYNTVCTVRNSASTSATALWQANGGIVTNNIDGSSGMYLCRSYDGTVRSTRSGHILKTTSSTFGVLSSAINTALNGPTTGADYAKIDIMDSGSQTGTVSATRCIPTRGWLPNILDPQNGGRGGLNSRDDLTNTPSMTLGKIVTQANTANSAYAIIQESDDWVPPSG
jgi:hypothetical protein